MLDRHAAAVVEERLATFRGVVVHGPRQAGKTTLVSKGLPAAHGRYVTLDDAQVLAAAKNDPGGFASLATPLIIDEVQRGGEPLVLAVKRRLDTNDDRGQILLTGSSNFLAVRSLKESLAGRVGFVRLLPLSQGEILGTRERFLNKLSEGPGGVRETAVEEPWHPRRYASAVALGGYPEVVTQIESRHRTAWFDAHLESVVERDARAASAIHSPTDLRRLLRALAALSGQLLVTASLAADLGLNRQTASSYIDLLATVFLIQRLPAWSSNELSRVTKTEKVHLVDTGLAAALRGWDEQRLADPTVSAAGGLWESFAVAELAKQVSFTENPPLLYHFRDKGGRHEVDVVLEWRDGRVAGVEIKRSSSVGRDDLGGLAWLRDHLGDRFVQGVVLYSGAETLPFGDRLTAAPLCTLWT